MELYDHINTLKNSLILDGIYPELQRANRAIENAMVLIELLGYIDRLNDYDLNESIIAPQKFSEDTLFKDKADNLNDSYQPMTILDKLDEDMSDKRSTKPKKKRKKRCRKNKHRKEKVHAIEAGSNFNNLSRKAKVHAIDNELELGDKEAAQMDAKIKALRSQMINSLRNGNVNENANAIHDLLKNQIDNTHTTKNYASLDNDLPSLDDNDNSLDDLPSLDDDDSSDKDNDSPSLDGLSLDDLDED